MIKAKARRKAMYQFNICLKDSEPKIWRRIQVPDDYTFWDLHVAIQDAMGWNNAHLFSFREIMSGFKRSNVEIGLPAEHDWNCKTYPAWEVNIDEVFQVGQVILYEYDFGDSWEHEILLEGILIREKGKRYPKCIAGEGACPPEDCGGLYGYERLLTVFAEKGEGYEEALEWCGHIDPASFDPNKVRFNNSKKLLRLVEG